MATSACTDLADDRGPSASNKLGVISPGRGRGIDNKVVIHTSGVDRSEYAPGLMRGRLSKTVLCQETQWRQDDVGIESFTSNVKSGSTFRLLPRRYAALGY